MRFTDWQLIIPIKAILADFLLVFILLFLNKLKCFLLNVISIQLILLQVSRQYDQFSVFVIVLHKILDLKAEVKLASLVPFTRHVDVTVEGFHDSLTDAQAEANSLLILLGGGIVQFAEHFEYLDLIAFSDSDTGVTN